MTVRRTKEEDLDAVMEIITEARNYFRTNHIPQWQGEYPAKRDIRKDMEQKGSWVIEDNGEIKGICFIAEITDPNYSYIEEGHWLDDNPYIVLHRTAVSSKEKGKGYASQFVRKAEELAEEKGNHDLRADTHENNTSMRHLLEKNGFVPCGRVYMSDGGPRIAYQKVLKDGKEQI
jgi:RimJ/RimL family protein N-acetyltransferase